MALTVLTEATKPYSFVESLVYDRVIAPAVLGMVDQMGGDFLPRFPDRGDALDVGCGGGHLLERLASERPGLRLTGIDLSADQVRRARRRMQPFGDRVHVQEASALALPFADARFDVVYSMASIKHWPDPLAGLRECCRVLKPGGRLLIVEADRGCRLEDVDRFVSGWRLPGALRPVAQVLFRTWVAGAGPDLDDARAWLQRLPLRETQVQRLTRTPGLLLEGIK